MLVKFYLRTLAYSYYFLDQYDFVTSENYSSTLVHQLGQEAQIRAVVRFVLFFQRLQVGPGEEGYENSAYL